MKQLLLTFFFPLFLGQSLAQKHDNIWLFGHDSFLPQPNDFGGSIIDFGSEPPSSHKDYRTMNLDITVASICDSMGNLLFYTNGAWVANYLHEQMENGDSLNPGTITSNNYNSGLRVAQSHFILPMPGYPGKYYLFHEKLDYHDVLILAVNPTYYSVIDMGQNNGLGMVEEKNVAIFNDTTKTFGTITAVKHANGRDWWVVFPEKAENNFYRCLLSPNGVEDLLIQNLSPAYPNINSNGFICFSPDGSRLARFEIQHGLYIYDFDRCEGLLADNPVFVPIPNTELGGGVAFSPNGRFVYMVSSTFILQSDTWASDIASTIDTVAFYDGYADPLPSTFFAMQPGPDGRIYITTNNETKILHYINQPNKASDSCEVVQHGLQLASYNRFTSPHFPNYRLGPLDGSPCDTLGLDNHPVAGFRFEANSTGNTLLVAFIDNSFYEPTDWYWDFGDGSTSTEVNPWHTFPGPGTYTVCLTVSNQYDSSMVCHDVVLVVSGTGEIAKSDIVTVFPNPASGEVHLQLRQQVAKAALFTLYTTTAQPMLTQHLATGKNTVSLEGLSPGLYFYEVRDEERILQSGKLIKIDD